MIVGGWPVPVPSPPSPVPQSPVPSRHRGTKKGVYRIALDDSTSAVVYVWSADEDYWDGLLPASSNDPESVFAHSSGIDLFEAATRRMESVGARSPRLFFTDRSRRLYPGDIAVAEDVTGGTCRTC